MSDVKTGVWQSNLNGSFINVIEFGKASLIYNDENCNKRHRMDVEELVGCYRYVLAVDDTPAQTLGGEQSAPIRFASFDLAASEDKTVTCDFFSIQDDTPKAVQILNEAVQIMAERGKSYDKSGGQAERSMPKIVAMFNALTGHELTPAQGWKFMVCLKLARSEQGEHREDNYLYGAAYFALAGEEAGEDSK